MLIGVSIGVGGCLVLFLSGYIGYKLNHKQVKQSQTDYELDQQLKRDEGFNNVMNYDYNIAVGKRVSK